MPTRTPILSWLRNSPETVSDFLYALRAAAAHRVAYQYHRLDRLETMEQPEAEYYATDCAVPAAGLALQRASVEGDGQMKRVDPLAGLATFLTIAELGSFAAAARRLDISPATVSAQIAELEARLQVRLVYRDTRHVSLTPAGEAYRQSLDGLLGQVQRSESIATRLSDEPEGTLKIAAPMGAADWLLRPAIDGVLARYPGISIDLRYSNDMVNLVEHGFDLAVRGAHTVEPNWIAPKIRPVRVYLVASPSYVQRHGSPATPHELAAHSCLHYSSLSFGQAWLLQKDGTTERIPITPRLTCDAAETLRQWALEGHGMTLLPDYFVGDDISSGRLVEMLPDWRPPGFDLNIVYPDNRHITRKVKVFVEALFADPALENVH
jgi:DNA-binding transcriptional LysR family regulator